MTQHMISGVVLLGVMGVLASAIVTLFMVLIWMRLHAHYGSDKTFMVFSAMVTAFSIVAWAVVLYDAYKAFIAFAAPHVFVQTYLCSQVYVP